MLDRAVPPRVRLTVRRTVHARLPVTARLAGCPSARGNAPAGGAVSAVRIPPNSDLPEARGTRDEYRPDASAPVPGGTEGAAAPATTTRRRGPSTSAAADRDQPPLAIRFRVDTCASGQTLKCLTIVDEWTRECLAIHVTGGIRSARVIEVLTQLVSTARRLRSACQPRNTSCRRLRISVRRGIWPQRHEGTCKTQPGLVTRGQPPSRYSRALERRVEPDFAGHAWRAQKAG